MKTNRDGDTLALHLNPDDVALLRLALKRATFEDTPTDRQNEILDFAVELLRQLGEEGDASGA